jgi:cysteine desulfurase
VHTVPHILNVSFLGRDTDYLLALIDKAGFAVSTKSACESDSEEGSRAVTVLTGDTERAKSTLRISWGPTTKKEDVERFGKELIRAIQFIDATRL